MNRLVIIGNGFDLAHGLPTGYCDFLKWYWGEFVRSVKYGLDTRAIQYEHDFVSISFNFSGWDLENNTDVKNKFISIDTYDKLCSFCEMYGGELMFENSFFKLINDKNSIQNWVDIENEYYQFLKESLKEDGNSQVKKLNEEFEQIKKLLEQYLIEVEEKYILEVHLGILNILTKTGYLDEECERLFEEFQSSEVENCRRHLLANDNMPYSSKYKIAQIRYLNFNYTSLINESIKYKDEEVIKEIQIHGKLNDSVNKINFGFGDEMDDDYKAIEKKDDNEYLRNIKSFAYLNTPNYKETIDFLELDKFQVYIMGHSCGLSDRILLNKVFEHKNCCSIKIYYHQKDGKDDYTNIAQNISRHFNKKEMMRERIVNKTLCEPLPQTQLPLK